MRVSELCQVPCSAQARRRTLLPMGASGGRNSPHSKRAPREAPHTALPLRGRLSPPQGNPLRLPYGSQTPRPTCSHGPVRPGWTEGDSPKKGDRPHMRPYGRFRRKMRCATMCYIWNVRSEAPPTDLGLSALGRCGSQRASRTGRRPAVGQVRA